MTKSNNRETVSLEQSLAELDAIVTQMEKGELSLEDSLLKFERGIQLMRFCQKTLNEAEQKVQILLADGKLEAFNLNEESLQRG